MPRPPSLSAADVNFPGSDYSFEELEFLRAMERYRRSNHRPFPTCREVLRVLLRLGYRKIETANEPDSRSPSGRG